MPSIELSTTSQITDNLTKTLGRQTLKVGFQWQRLGFSILQPIAARGTWAFSGLYTEVPTTTGGNTGLAQMLLTPIPGTVPGASDYVGGADSVSASNIANTSMQHRYYAGYFQDDFRVTSKLTLNLGLRYEYFGQLKENYGAQSNFLTCRGKRALDVLANAETLQYSIVCRTSRLLRRRMALISSVPASRVSACRRRETSRRDSDLPIKSLPSWWCEVDTGSSTAVSKIP